VHADANSLERLMEALVRAASSVGPCGDIRMTKLNLDGRLMERRLGRFLLERRYHEYRTEVKVCEPAKIYCGSARANGVRAQTHPMDLIDKFMCLYCAQLVARS
jgi:hypothetical protein